jgi:chlorophyll synthase
LYVAIAWTLLSLAVATVLGAWGFAAAVLGLALAWAYSAPPLRLKRNGWYGNAACAACYEGLPWFTGAALMAGTLPDTRTILAAVLYSVGAHGIMTLNDFKSIAGDRLTGIDSLPVQLGTDSAARTACVIMLVPQLIVIALLFAWSQPLHAAAVAALVVMQVRMMLRFIAAPLDKALWYSGFGVPLYVLGMMITAFAIRGLVA